MKYIKAEGPRDARLVIVGEAPGAEEEMLGRPFVGKSGAEVDRVLRDNGIVREECYITNVVKYRPPDNKLDRLHEIGIRMEDCVRELKAELEELNPNCILVLGNTALQALCGLTGIKRWRGSILRSSLLPGRKVVASIHPAAALHGEIQLLALIRADFHRARRESRWPDFRSIPKRHFLLNPSFKEVIQTLHMFKGAKFLSLDIETIKGTEIITEVGIGNSPTFAMTIPIYKDKPVWTMEEETAIWHELRYLLTCPDIGKIMQNINFERTMLHKWVGEIYPVYFDTMIGAHLCYCELPKDLSTISSLYANEPHWKSDRTADTYNVKDVTVTQEAAENIDEELAEIGLTEFMHGYQMPYSAILWRATMKGVKVNLEKQAAYRAEAEAQLTNLQTALDAHAGCPLNINSSKQVAQYLYNELHLPVQRHKGSITTNEAALNRLMLRTNHPVLSLILEMRGLSKSISTFLNSDIIDADGRIRTEWVITGTETGRLSSRQNIRGGGANMQTQPKNIRDIYEADPGHTFIVGDMSQVEARLVAWFSGDPNYMGMFKSGLDIHRQVASWIFKTPVELIMDDERKRAKATAHGTPYGMGPKLVASIYNIPVEEAKWLQGEYWRLFPQVRTHFQEAIVQQLRNDRTLINPFGRRRTFFGWWGEDLFRGAYANLPQGTAADIINRAGLRAMHRMPQTCDLLLQIHDELVIQVPDDYVDAGARIFKEEVEKPVYIRTIDGKQGEWLSVPLDVKTGKNWKDTVQWNG